MLSSDALEQEVGDLKNTEIFDSLPLQNDYAQEWGDVGHLWYRNMYSASTTSRGVEQG